MDKRFQVFVSSTFVDLQEERAAVVSALLQLDAIPAGMELFPAADDDAWTLIERVLDTSDYYLLVIGGKYGSIDPASLLSFTEKEFDLAVALKKPVMAFLHEKPQAIPMGKSEIAEVTREKLQAFRDKVQASKHVKFWTSPDDLAGKVALSYANFQRTYPAIGWIRGDAQASAEALNELNDLRKQLRTAEQRLASARNTPPPGTTHLSQGDDHFAVDARTKVIVQTKATTSTGSWTGTLPVKISWNELFSRTGPQLLNEASQTAVHRSINTLLTERFSMAAEDAVAKAVVDEDEDDEVTNFRSVDVSLASDDFNTILIQFRALGLVRKSERKRSIADTATYWTLTPYGDEHLTTLRAISRSSVSDGSASS